MSETGHCESCGEKLSLSETDYCTVCRSTIAPNLECDQTLTASPGMGPEPDKVQATPKVNPELIPGYRLKRLIASGGMGKVYEAEQFGTNRTVALKMMLSGEFADSESIERFRSEAMAIGMLEHPNVMTIYEVNECDGRPFYSMQLITGGSLAQRLPELRRNPRLGAQIMAKVARGVHYIHQNGLLHRDLKPPNILMDGNEPIVTDFGLAKHIKSPSGLTLSGQVMGTPGYMSPEQAMGDSRRLTTATDIYGLGAVFYHIMTGQAPFAGDSPLVTMEMVRSEEPQRPTQIDSGIDRDLETICLKCLEKKPEARYGSAEALALELERWLNNEPILARPATTLERCQKWIRRRPAIAAIYAIVILASIVLLIRERQNLTRITAERDVAREMERVANDTVNEMRFEKAESLFAEDNAADAMAYLAAILRDQPTNTVVLQRLTAALRHRSWPRPLLNPLTHEAPLRHARFCPRGRSVVTASDDGKVSAWDAEKGTSLFSFSHSNRVNTIDFNREGTLLLTAGMDGHAQLMQLDSGKPIATLPHPSNVTSARFSPDGSTILTSSIDTNSPRLWRLDGSLRKTLPQSTRTIDARFSPDGRYILAISAAGAFHLWSRVKDEWRASPLTNRVLRRIRLARFSPDGSRFAVVGDNQWQCWDLHNLQPLAINDPPHETLIRDLAFSADGRLIATASQDQTAKVWNAGTGSLISDLRHRSPVNSVTFDSTGTKLLTASASGRARIWDPEHGTPLCEWMRHEAGIRKASFDPAGDRVVTAAREYTAVVWDIKPSADNPRLLAHGPRLRGARFRPRSSQIVTFNYVVTNQHSTVQAANELKIWSLEDEPELLHKIRCPNPIRDARYSPDGTLLLTIERNPGYMLTQLWNADTAVRIKRLDSYRTTCADFSPDNRWIATGEFGGLTRIWQRNSNGVSLRHSCTNSHHLASVRFSPDSKLLATGSQDGIVRLWNTSDFRKQREFSHPNDPIVALAFSPDGSRIATASESGLAQIWDAETGRRVGRRITHEVAINSLQFSPDGEMIVTASDDFTAVIHSAVTGAPISPPLRHERSVLFAAFSPDSRQVITTSKDQTARLWDARSGRPVTGPLAHGLQSSEDELWVKTAEYESDGKHVITACFDGNTYVWHVAARVPRMATAEFLARVRSVTRRRLVESGQVEMAVSSGLSR